MNNERGKLFVVGIGPGSFDEMTFHVRQVLIECDVVVGYSAYIDLIAPICEGKVVISSGMGKETERCEAALREALTGKKVTLVSSGDAGIFGMAGLALEIAISKGIDVHDAIEIVPGIPAFAAAAALVGAPIMHDFACISLSDLLTPWETIQKRLTAVAAADFVTCLYNPRSKKRTSQIEYARETFLKHRHPDTPCSIIRNAFRKDQTVILTTLNELLNHRIDMLCIVIIGNSQTKRFDQWMITPRGYKIGEQ